ncbi:enhanced serine sensitivity protein SseB C-terminal domain-containing protein [Rhodanobacter sp. B2A1Ga4]|uniref:SseB family protein n=1 Tax=Rhodanobacter sp. B2A1Ga4 TaxID=2778647 RepID=UPI001B360466|nr:SseB family protein [Rhodanobacter sp. B2A1Ga4]MBQ4853611.1 enhanced serine sensitivity protein SseB C-terminal domain-containing protein [Rhodanobacter sp. B2A1Ga4]
MTTVTTPQLQTLLQAARSPANPGDGKRVEEAFFKALLACTMYAHVPAGPVPADRIRFIQFVRPDNSQTVLPFFSDREQAEMASAGKVGIVAMSGRRLFELTQGATLMLNPNVDQVALYPPEIKALLEWRPLGFFTQDALQQGEPVGVCPPTVPTDALVLALRELFMREPAVRAGYLLEVHRGTDDADVFLLLTLVVTSGNEERLVQLTTLELNSTVPPAALPVTLTCVPPDAPLPEICHHGIQFYGT